MLLTYRAADDASESLSKVRAARLAQLRLDTCQMLEVMMCVLQLGRVVDSSIDCAFPTMPFTEDEWSAFVVMLSQSISCKDALLPRGAV